MSMDLHRLRVVEFDTLLSEKGDNKNILELGDSKHEDCKTLCSDDNDNETNQLECDKIFLRDHASPPESSKISSFVKYKSTSEIFNISPKEKLMQTQLNVNTSLADVKKPFQENLQSQKKRTLHLFNKRARNKPNIKEKKTVRKKKDEVNFLFTRETPSFMRYARKRAKNVRTNYNDHKVINDVFGFQENRSTDPRLYQTSCNYLNVDKVSAKKKKNGSNRKPKPKPASARDCFCKHHAMKILASPMSGSVKKEERKGSIYYNLNIHPCPRKTRFNRVNSIYEEVWDRDIPQHLATDKNVEVSPSSLIAVAKNYCNANIQCSGPSLVELTSRLQGLPSGTNHKVSLQRHNKPYPQYSTPSPGSESNGSEQHQPQVVTCKRKRISVKKMFSIINHQRTKFFSGFFQRVNAFHIKYALGKKCIKYAFFGLLIVVWSPCLLAVILAWAVMCPVKMTNMLNKNNKTKSLLPLLSSFANKLRKKSTRSDYERMCFGDQSYTKTRNLRSSVANWYARAANTVVDSYNALLAMFKFRNKPPTCAGSSFLTSTHPNRQKRYTLFYADNRGWMMKPARRSNVRPFPGTRVMQTMRCEFRPKFWRKSSAKCRKSCPRKDAMEGTVSSENVQMKVSSLQKLYSECLMRGAKKRKTATNQKGPPRLFKERKVKMEPQKPQKTRGPIPNVNPANGKTACECRARGILPTSILCDCPASGMASCFCVPTSGTAKKFQKNPVTSTAVDACPKGLSECICKEVMKRGSIQCMCSKSFIKLQVNNSMSNNFFSTSGAFNPPIYQTAQTKPNNLNSINISDISQNDVAKYRMSQRKNGTLPFGVVVDCGTKHPFIMNKLTYGTYSFGLAGKTLKMSTKYTPSYNKKYLQGQSSTRPSTKYESSIKSKKSISIHRTDVTEITKTVPPKFSPLFKTNRSRAHSTKCDVALNSPCGNKKHNRDKKILMDSSRDRSHTRIKNVFARLSQVVSTKQAGTSTYKINFADKTQNISKQSVSQNVRLVSLNKLALNKQSVRKVCIRECCLCKNELNVGTESVLPKQIASNKKAVDCSCSIENQLSTVAKKLPSKQPVSKCACKDEPSTKKEKHRAEQSLLNKNPIYCEWMAKTQLNTSKGRAIKTASNCLCKSEQSVCTNRTCLKQIASNKKAIHRSCTSEKKSSTATKVLPSKQSVSKCACKDEPITKKGKPRPEQSLSDKKAIDCGCMTENQVSTALKCPCKYKLSVGTKKFSPKQFFSNKKTVDCSCSTEKKSSTASKELLSKQQVSKCACNDDSIKKKVKSRPEQSLPNKKAIDCGCLTENQLSAALNCPGCKCKLSVGTKKFSPKQFFSNKKTVDCSCSTEKKSSTASKELLSKQQVSKCACNDYSIKKKVKSRPEQSLPDKKAIDCGCLTENQLSAALNCPGCKCKLSVGTKKFSPKQFFSNKKTVDCSCSTEKKSSTASKELLSKQQVSKCACNDDSIKKKVKSRPEQSLPDKKAIDCGCLTENQLSAALNCPGCKCKLSVGIKKFSPKQFFSNKKTVDCSCSTEKKSSTASKELLSKQQVSKCACNDDSIKKKVKSRPEQSLPDKKAIDCGCLTENQLSAALNCPGCKCKLSVGTKKFSPKQFFSNKKTVDCSCSTEKKSSTASKELLSKQQVSKCACNDYSIKKKVKSRPEQSLPDKKAIDCGCLTENQLSAALNCPGCKCKLSVGIKKFSPKQFFSNKKTVDCSCSTEKKSSTASKELLSKQQVSKCACNDDSIKKKVKSRPKQSLPDKKAIDCGCVTENQLSAALNCPCKCKLSVGTKKVSPKQIVSNKKSVDCSCSSEKKSSIAAKELPSKQTISKCACKDELITKNGKTFTEESMAKTQSKQILPNKEVVECSCRTEKKSSTADNELPSKQSVSKCSCKDEPITVDCGCTTENQPSIAINCPCKSKLSVGTKTVPPKQVVSNKKAVGCSCRTKRKSSLAKILTSKKSLSKCTCKDEQITKKEKSRPEQSLPDKKAIECGCMTKNQPSTRKGPAIQTALNCPCKSEQSIGTQTVRLKQIESNKKAVDYHCSDKKPSTTANKLLSKQPESICACKDEPNTKKDKPYKNAIARGCMTENQPTIDKGPAIRTALNCPCKSEQSIGTETVRLKQNESNKKAVDCSCTTEKEPVTAARKRLFRLPLSRYNCKDEPIIKKGIPRPDQSLPNKKAIDCGIENQPNTSKSSAKQTALNCPCKSDRSIGTETVRRKQTVPYRKAVVEGHIQSIVTDSETNTSDYKLQTSSLEELSLRVNVSEDHSLKCKTNLGFRDKYQPTVIASENKLSGELSQLSQSDSRSLQVPIKKKITSLLRRSVLTQKISKCTQYGESINYREIGPPKQFEHFKTPTRDCGYGTDNQPSTTIVAHLIEHQRRAIRVAEKEVQVLSQQATGAQFGVALDYSYGDDSEVLINQEAIRQPSFARKTQPQIANNNVKLRSTTANQTDSLDKAPSQQVIKNNQQQQTHYPYVLPNQGSGQQPNDSPFGVALNCFCGKEGEVGTFQETGLRQLVHLSHGINSNSVLKTQPQIAVDNTNVNLKSPSTITTDQTSSSEKQLSELSQLLSRQPAINNKQQQTQHSYVLPQQSSTQLYEIAPNCSCQTQPKTVVDNNARPKIPSTATTDKTSSIDNPQNKILIPLSSQQMTVDNKQQQRDLPTDELHKQTSSQQVKDSPFGVTLNCPCGKDRVTTKTQESRARKPTRQSQRTVAECACKVQRIKPSETRSVDPPSPTTKKGIFPPYRQTHSSMYHGVSSDCDRDKILRSRRVSVEHISKAPRHPLSQQRRATQTQYQIPQELSDYQQSTPSSQLLPSKSLQHMSKFSRLVMKLRSKFCRSKKNQKIQIKLPDKPVYLKPCIFACPVNTSTQLKVRQVGKPRPSFFQRSARSQKSKTSPTKTVRSYLSHAECVYARSRYSQSSTKSSVLMNSRTSCSMTYGECRCTHSQCRYPNLKVSSNNSKVYSEKKKLFTRKPVLEDKKSTKSSRSSFFPSCRDECLCQDKNSPSSQSKLFPNLFKGNKKQQYKISPKPFTVMSLTSIVCCETSSTQNGEKSNVQHMSTMFTKNSKLLSNSMSQRHSGSTPNFSPQQHLDHLLYRGVHKKGHGEISRSFNVQTAPIIPVKYACLSEKCLRQLSETMSQYSQSNSSQPIPVVAKEQINSGPVPQGSRKTRKKLVESDKLRLSTEPVAFSPPIETEKSSEFSQQLDNGIKSQKPPKTHKRKTLPQDYYYPNQYVQRPYSYDPSRPIIPIIPGTCTCALKQRLSEYLRKIAQANKPQQNNILPEISDSSPGIHNVSKPPPNEQKILSVTLSHHSHKDTTGVEGQSECSQHAKSSPDSRAQPSRFAQVKRLQSDRVPNVPHKTIVGIEEPPLLLQSFNQQYEISKPIVKQRLLSDTVSQYSQKSMLLTDVQAESNQKFPSNKLNSLHNTPPGTEGFLEVSHTRATQQPEISKYSGNLGSPPVPSVKKQQLQQGSVKELPRKTNIGTDRLPEIFQYLPSQPESSPPCHELYPAHIIPGKYTCSDGKYKKSLEVVANHIKRDSRETNLQSEPLHLPYQYHISRNHPTQNFQQSHMISSLSANKIPYLGKDDNHYSNIKSQTDKLIELSGHIIVQRSEIMQSPQNLQKNLPLKPVLKRNAPEYPTKESIIFPEETSPILLQQRTGEAAKQRKSVKQQAPDFNRVTMRYSGNKSPAKKNPPAVGVPCPPNYSGSPCHDNPANKCGPKACFDELPLRRAYKRKPLRHTPPKQQPKSKKGVKQKNPKEEKQPKEKEKQKENEKKKKEQSTKSGKNGYSPFNMFQCWKCVQELVGEAEKDAWPNDVSCRPIYIHTLKRKPCFWVFKLAPSLYPAFLGCLKLQRSVCQMCFYVIALCLWSPFLLCFYVCFNLLCKI